MSLAHARVVPLPFLVTLLVETSSENVSEITSAGGGLGGLGRPPETRVGTGGPKNVGDRFVRVQRRRDNACENVSSETEHKTATHTHGLPLNYVSLLYYTPLSRGHRHGLWGLGDNLSANDDFPPLHF